MSPAKTQGLAVGLGGMFFGRTAFPLLEIAHGHAGVLDVGATGEARHFDCGARRSVAELKPPRVMLIHDPHRNIGSQVRIDENHVGEFKAGCLQDGLHAVERQIDLCCRIIRNLATRGIAARHAGNKKPVMSEHARRSGILRFVVRRIDRPACPLRLRTATALI